MTFRQAARELLKLYCLQNFDPDLYNTQGKTPTTTAVLLTQWFCKLKPQDLKHLQAGTQKSVVLYLRFSVLASF